MSHRGNRPLATRTNTGYYQQSAGSKLFAGNEALESLLSARKFDRFDMALPRTHAVETPFDSVENAQSYIQLLIETLVEAKREIAADAASARSARSERRLEALRLVEYKLHRLEHHLTVSGRMLNDLRRLRRLLLDETADLNLSSSPEKT